MLKIGGETPTQVYIGAQPVLALYMGTERIWPVGGTTIGAVTITGEIITAPAFDPDAAAYIAAVEAADGQALEDGVRQAIDDLVVTLKATTGWAAMDSFLPMAGPRTLAGALVPLRGDAPQFNNLVAGDYSRTLGITGDGIAKVGIVATRTAGRRSEDVHLSVYADYRSTASLGVLVGTNLRLGVATQIFAETPNTLVFCAAGGGLPVTPEPVLDQAPAFYGVARNSDLENAEVWRSTQSTYSTVLTGTGNAGAASPYYGILAQEDGSVLRFPAPATACCFSQGPYYNQPMQVRAAINTYLAALATAIQPEPPVVSDPDAAAYIAAVEAADGQALEDAIRVAIDDFVIALKAAPGLWESLPVLAPLAGARTVEGAMVPLRGAAGPFTATNVTSGDYDRIKGFTFGPTSNIILGSPDHEWGSTLTGIGALSTVQVDDFPPPWAHLVLYDRWPDERGLISAADITPGQGNVLMMGMQTNDAGIFTESVVLPLAANNYLAVSRISDTQHRSSFSGGTVVRNSVFTPESPERPIAHSFSPNQGFTMMGAFFSVGLSDANNNALRVILTRFQEDLATAIP
jgi:hypothetical protein